MHVDMDAFFASVEQRDNPALRGKPVAVAGGGPRGVIAAASYEARQYGVYSAMPGSRARRLCPNLIFVPHRFDAYKEASGIIRSLFLELTDLVEPLSLDEAFLDISHLQLEWGEAEDLARQLKNNILESTQLTSTAGISINKFLAKMASGLNKPDGLTIILPDDAEAFLEALPIHKFFGVGKVTATKMKQQGINTGLDLKGYSELELAQRFGKMGRYFYKVVRGLDDRKVEPNRDRKSLSVERTYEKDMTDETSIYTALATLSEELSNRLKKSRVTGNTITLKVRFDDFSTLTRQKPFVNKSVAPEILNSESRQLLEQIKPLKPIRLLGLGMSGFKTDASSGQLVLDI